MFGYLVQAGHGIFRPFTLSIIGTLQLGEQDSKYSKWTWPNLSLTCADITCSKLESSEMLSQALLELLLRDIESLSLPLSSLHESHSNSTALLLLTSLLTLQGKDSNTLNQYRQSRQLNRVEKTSEQLPVPWNGLVCVDLDGWEVRDEVLLDRLSTRKHDFSAGTECAPLSIATPEIFQFEVLDRFHAGRLPVQVYVVNVALREEIR